MPPEPLGHAACDGGTDDPRLLIHRYQQQLREQLLAKAAEEASRGPWWSLRALKRLRGVRAAPSERGLERAPAPIAAPTRAAVLSEGAA